MRLEEGVCCADVELRVGGAEGRGGFGYGSEGGGRGDQDEKRGQGQRERGSVFEGHGRPVWALWREYLERTVFNLRKGRRREQRELWMDVYVVGVESVEQPSVMLHTDSTSYRSFSVMYVRSAVAPRASYELLGTR